jgi:hypothetical protein
MAVLTDQGVAVPVRDHAGNGCRQGLRTGRAGVAEAIAAANGPEPTRPIAAPASTTVMTTWTRTRPITGDNRGRGRRHADLPPPASEGTIVRMSGRIYSVGYEGLRVPGLVDALVAAGVSLLVDVRLNPVSRKPGWSKNPLRASLEAASIDYRHEATLGNPPDNRDGFRQGDGQAARRRLGAILVDRSGDALQRLVDDARERRIAVLCVERSARHCHRQLVTDMAQQIDPGIEVVDIL